MSILIVDDVLPNITFITKAIQMAGYKDIVAVSSAKEAFEFLHLDDEIEKPQVELILLDILMPEVNGIEACKKIKASGQYKETPIYMVTAFNDSHIDDALQAGASGFITKPIMIPDLLKLLKEVFG